MRFKHKVSPKMRGLKKLKSLSCIPKYTVYDIVYSISQILNFNFILWNAIESNVACKYFARLGEENLFKNQDVSHIPVFLYFSRSNADFWLLGLENRQERKRHTRDGTGR